MTEQAGGMGYKQAMQSCCGGECGLLMLLFIVYRCRCRW